MSASGHHLDRSMLARDLTDEEMFLVNYFASVISAYHPEVTSRFDLWLDEGRWHLDVSNSELDCMWSAKDVEDLVGKMKSDPEGAS